MKVPMPTVREVWEDIKEIVEHRITIIPYGFRHIDDWDWVDWAGAIMVLLSLFVLLFMP